MIIFDSVQFLSKTITKQKFFFKKKNWNQTETGSNRLVSVRFDFLRAKTGSNWFGSVFLVLARFYRFWLGFFLFWLGFFRFGSVFLIWLGFSGFFRFWFGLFFWFSAYRTEPAGFFKILIGFFLFGFFSFCFSGFLGLIDFLIFLLIPINFYFLKYFLNYFLRTKIKMILFKMFFLIILIYWYKKLYI